MPCSDNRPRVFVPATDLEQRAALERQGYVIESGLLRGYVMLKDYPAGLGG